MNDTEENDEIQNIVNNAMDTVNETALETTVPTDATNAGELPNVITDNASSYNSVSFPHSSSNGRVAVETVEVPTAIPNVTVSIPSVAPEMDGIHEEETDIRPEEARFSGAEWFSAIKNFGVSVIGLGGIGSHAAFAISRLRPLQMNLFDPDTVEDINLAGQLFNAFSIGRTKTEAVEALLRDYSNYGNIMSHSRTFNPTCDIFTDITVLGLDNMRSRKYVFTDWHDCPRDNILLIDGRLSAEEFQIFAIQKNDTKAIERYKDFLFSDEEAEPARCSYKQTTFMASMIGDIITNIIVNYATNTVENRLFDREIPFFTYYNAATMVFKTEGV